MGTAGASGQGRPGSGRPGRAAGGQLVSARIAERACNCRTLRTASCRRR
jgi:hypothetical protein